MVKLSLQTKDYFRIRSNCKANEISGILIKKRDVNELFLQVMYKNYEVNIQNDISDFNMNIKIKHIHLVDPKKYDSNLDMYYTGGFYSFLKKCNIQQLLRCYGYTKNDKLVLLEVE